MENSSQKSLPVLLLSFTKKLVAKLNELEEKGYFTKRQILYTKPSISSFNYKEGGNVEYRASFDHIVKESRVIKDRKAFLDKHVKSISEYKQLLKEIGKRSSCSEEQASSVLDHLIQHLEQKESLQLSEESLFDIVSLFMGDITNSPIWWTVTAFLQGIWLKQKSHQITEEILIRQPEKGDYEKESIAYPMAPFGRPTGFPSASAVLQLNLLHKSLREIQEEVGVVINTLRLFKLGSVFYLKYEMTPESITRFGGTLGAGNGQATHYKYVIEPQDIAGLSTFISRIKPLVPKDIEGHVFTSDFIVIAFKRYLDALIRRGSPESRITAAITCLESLYLKAAERMELAHRLAQRTSALLRLFDYRALEVYNNVTRAYDIRSTFIHGSSTAEKDKSSLGELCKTIMQYARVSLLVSMQLQNTLEKEQLINKLDNSLLDNSAYSKLQKAIGENDIMVTS